MFSSTAHAASYVLDMLDVKVHTCALHCVRHMTCMYIHVIPSTAHAASYVLDMLV